MWRVGSLAKLLRSQSLLGYLTPDKRNGGSPPVDKAGKRVRRAEPILSWAEWDQLQAELDRREGVKGPRERSAAAMLLRVAHCGHETDQGPCGTRMYPVKSKDLRYYRCGTKAIGGVAGGGSAVQAKVLEAVVQDAFLDKVADLEVKRRVFVAGQDQTAEIRETEDALGRLAQRLAKVPDGSAADAVINLMAEHTNHLNELRALPSRPAGWVLEGTGETYGQVWSRLDHTGRGKLLRDSGIRVEVRGAKPLNVSIDFGVFEEFEAAAIRSAAAVMAA